MLLSQRPELACFCCSSWSQRSRVERSSFITDSQTPRATAEPTHLPVRTISPWWQFAGMENKSVQLAYFCWLHYLSQSLLHQLMNTNHFIDPPRNCWNIQHNSFWLCWTEGVRMQWDVILWTKSKYIISWLLVYILSIFTAGAFSNRYIHFWCQTVAPQSQWAHLVHVSSPAELKQS